ncbi:MAG TPA: DUF1569 domain-containing protein [Flavobacteriales bacterium]|nr:DUF1569 domain-containing protein [Flavobacteriales bacterium]
MKDFFQPDTLNDLVLRINKISNESKPLWGVMNAAQMFAHCNEAFRSAVGKEKHPRAFMGRIVGRMALKSFTGPKPLKKNLPTAKEFKITSHREFEQEKKNLLVLVEQFSKGGPTSVSTHPHPFFGKMNHYDWNRLMYKHLDHHLQQFGV